MIMHVRCSVNPRGLRLVVLAGGILLAAWLGVACTSTPSSAPGALDLRATLSTYLNSLREGWSGLSPAALNDYNRSAKPFMVDIREAKEVADADAGYIIGSVDIPIRSLIKNLDKLPAKDQPIVVTCGNGHGSALALEALQLLGYQNVKTLVGGVTAW